MIRPAPGPVMVTASAMSRADSALRRSSKGVVPVSAGLEDDGIGGRGWRWRRGSPAGASRGRLSLVFVTVKVAGMKTWKVPSGPAGTKLAEVSVTWLAWTATV